MGAIFCAIVWAWASTILLTFPPCVAFRLPFHWQSTPVLPRYALSNILFSDGKHNMHNRLLLAATSNTDDGDPMGGNDDENAFSVEAQDLRLFVTQRCIQSFMYLLSSTRDLHTVSWLDGFVQPITINNYWDEDDDYKPGAEDTFRENDKRIGSKLLNYHGLSALNTTIFPEWDSFFTSLLEQPDTVLKIATPKEAGHRSYSEFDIDVEPARLCARILSVREQIAREMTGDLKAIANMGQLIFSSYWQNAKDRRDTKQTKGIGTGPGHDEESAPYGFDRPSSMYINFDPRDDDACAPSPLRKGNFDLLYNLLTQSAVLDLIESEDGVVVGDDCEVQNKASQLFLSKFYNDRLVTHFVGSQWYSKGDDFIEELMLSSPIMMSLPRDGGSIEEKYEENSDSKESNTPPLVLEPMRIAEQILLKRDKLALEWMHIMEAVPSEHTEIRKLQLDRLTGVAEVAPMHKIFEDEFQ